MPHANSAWAGAPECVSANRPGYAVGYHPPLHRRVKCYCSQSHAAGAKIWARGPLIHQMERDEVIVECTRMDTYGCLCQDRGQLAITPNCANMRVNIVANPGLPNGFV